MTRVMIAFYGAAWCLWMCMVVAALNGAWDVALGCGIASGVATLVVIDLKEKR